jgi:hypothetical protein
LGGTLYGIHFPTTDMGYTVGYDSRIYGYGNAVTSISPSEPISSMFTVYPSPTRDRITVQLHGVANAALRIWSLNGMLVQEAVLDRATTEHGVGHLAPGIYLVELATDLGRESHRLVVE